MQIVESNFTHASGLLARATDFDLSSVTDRYCQEFEVSREIAELHAAECKKYLFLCSLFPDEPLGMKGPVDNYWHTFLLFTKEYDRFCRQLGGSFIHHVPATSGHSGGTFEETMSRYRSVFGAEPDKRAWPQTKGASDCEDIGSSCSDGPGPNDCTPTSDCNGGRCASY